MITALHRSVSGYAVADGRTKWSVDLPADICATPNSTTSDGKIVIGVKSRTSDRADCSVLQMVDLNTGKAGWKTTIKKSGTGDMLSDIGLTISGNTVIAGRTSNFNAYQVSDGKELFGTPAESCKIFAFAGGPKLIAAANCSTDDVKNPQHQVLELDRVSGKAKMTYQPPRGWKVEKVYSVDPLIVRLGLGDMSKKQHAIAAISKSGKLLSQMIPSKDDVLVASCGNTFALFDTRLEGCSGVVADANTFYMATKPKGEYGSAPTNKVIVFDLGTGEPKWTANAPQSAEWSARYGWKTANCCFTRKHGMTCRGPFSHFRQPAAPPAYCSSIPRERTGSRTASTRSTSDTKAAARSS
ncbi:PQQ-binding-like beta-propeller repeat protein [Streptomyces arboris]|uniref:outer membrane protein assembly factor BamB family protein n=1 Tax=Streptomyces arboris TaxID=2600619 RepID=UPI003C2EC0E8